MPPSPNHSGTAVRQGEGGRDADHARLYRRPRARRAASRAQFCHAGGRGGGAGRAGGRAAREEAEGHGGAARARPRAGAAL